MTPDEVFSLGLVNVPDSSTHSGCGSTHSGDSFTHNGDSSTHSATDHSASGAEFNASVMRDEHGRLLNNYIDLPYIDSVESLTDVFRESLYSLAAIPRERLRLGDKELMRKVILSVCHGQYISVAALGQILKRNPNALRQQYLKILVEQGELKLAFPQYKNDPKQGYSAA